MTLLLATLGDVVIGLAALALIVGGVYWLFWVTGEHRWESESGDEW